MRCFFRAVSLVLLTLLLGSTITVSASDTKYTVGFSSPAIPADVGETVDLSDYIVEFASGSAAVSSGISWTSTDITINGGKITPAAAGVYKINASVTGKTKTVYLVVKNPADKDYVLYYNDFSSMSDIRIIQETAGTSTKILDGNLSLDASNSASGYIRVLLPMWLKDFGDYAIETSTTISAAVDNTKWLSLMFRIQNSDYPYWQMAARQNMTASSGTELAERNAANGWTVNYKGAYSEAFDADKYYTLTARVRGNRAATYINGERMLFSDTMTYPTGEVGLQARGVNALFDYIKITLQTDDIKPSESSFYSVRDPSSNIILPPSIITYVDSKDKLSKILSTSPATAVFYIDYNLMVKDKNGNIFSTVDDAIRALGGKIIPAFYITDRETVAPLCSYLQINDIKDVFIISAEADIVALARGQWKHVRGVVDFTDADINDLYSLRETANKSGARVIILPANAAEYTSVEYLQRLFMTVWIDNGNSGDAAGLVNSITSGANGIITSDRELLEKCFTEYFVPSSMVRAINIIGHRGAPSISQENSLAGSVSAYESGATMVENDIYMTTDRVIFIMHDSTVDRTTNGTGNCVNMSYADIQKLQIDVNKTVKTEPVPTLEDYFKEFSGKDVQILIEVKTADTGIIPKLVELINKYDITGQVNVITFSEPQLLMLKQLMPGMSLGYLNSAITMNESEVLVALEKAMEKTQAFDTTFNPSYASGALGSRFLVAASYRGMTVWPWTINDKGVFDTYFMYGTYGITTNYSQYVTDYVKHIDVLQDSVSFSSGGSADISVTKTTYGRVASAADNAEMVIIERNEGLMLSYSEGKISATGSGSASVMFRISAETSSGQQYFIYTQPVSVSVSSSETESTATNDSVDTKNEISNNSTAENENNIDNINSNLIYIAGGVIVSVAVVLAVAAIISSKKKKK